MNLLTRLFNLQKTLVARLCELCVVYDVQVLLWTSPQFKDTQTQTISDCPQNADSANGDAKKSRGGEGGQESCSPVIGVPAEVREEVERLYKLPMPDDFYHFWDFCKQLYPESPRGM